MTFRARTFAGFLVACAMSVAVATWLIERPLLRYMRDDAEQGLTSQARVVAALIAERAERATGDADALADELGRLVHARVTLLAPDGRVIGDSAVEASALPIVENHASRPEVVEALRSGEGRASRHSNTTGVETIYVAVALRGGPVGVARVAVSLETVDQRLGTIRRLALIGLLAGWLVALGLTWVTSVLLSRRLRVVADTARRYREGDFSRPARDHGTDEIGIVAGVLDDTAHELGARLAGMAREQAHMAAILSGMIEGVVLVDAAGRLVLTNPAARAMLQLTGEFEGVQYLEVVRQPDVARQLSTALGGAAPEPVEVSLERDARQIFVANVVPVATARGGGAVLVLHDITALRRADQVRRDFVANVSHELRTPLTAIRGYVEALLDAPPEADQTRHFLEIIGRHSERMERLVRDLLRLARLDAGQETLDRTDCRLATLVAGVERDLESQLSSKRLRLDVALAADAETVSGDPAKLHDVVRNLIENASNYAPAGRRDRGGQSAIRRPGRPDRGGSRAGHSGGGLAADLRAVLSGRSIAHPGPRRHGAGSVHRAAPGGAARRPRHGGEPSGRRRRVRGHASGRFIAPLARR